ncbi:MAG: nitrate reductase [Proteobacteria bacterium]|nr:MAG: nitrate reductase [Pseudomonadota bacterium]
MKTDHSAEKNRRGVVTEVVDQPGRIENVGVEHIPDDQRRSSLMNVVWILAGGSMTFSLTLIGWIPVSLGLGWWDSVSAIVIGTAIGSTFLGPMALFGPRTGTNSPVSSGAHFGAVGRLIGSALGVSACLVFAALSVWAAGDALAGSTARLAGAGEAGLTLKSIAYAIVSIIMIVIAVMGHANMVAFCKWMVPLSGSMMLLGIFAFYPNFDSNYSGGNYALGSFWPTWFAGAIACAATCNSYSPYTGDWTRHIPKEKYKSWQIIVVTWLGCFFGMGGAYMWGAYTAVTFTDPTMNYAIGMVEMSPGWYLLPVLFIALVPGTAQAVINIYSMGLDFSAIVPKLSRVQSTILLGIVATVLVYIGAVYEQVANLVASFLAILIIVGAPWVMINIIGFINRRGYYYPEHLQVFNRGEEGGRYWFVGGLEPRATVAWATAVLVGIFFINTGWYVSPGAKMLGETDIGLIVSTTTAALVYITLLYKFPEPAYLFGPEGATFRMNESAIDPLPIRSVE